MPSLRQTAVAISGAVKTLETKGVKPGSRRAVISTSELGGSAGQVFDHLLRATEQERQAVADAVTVRTGALKKATANAKAARAAIGTAIGKRDKAAAELNAVKADAHLSVVKVGLDAAEAHARAAAPADKLEDDAAELQAKAEDARNAADDVCDEGEADVASAEDEAAGVIAEAEEAYDIRMTEIENEVKSALGI